MVHGARGRIPGEAWAKIDRVGRDPWRRGPANATVMSWHGIDGAVTAAKSGHDTVLAASPILYLDHMQSSSGDEPPGRPDIIDWREFYGFDPSPPALTAAERRHILGLQANLWTEHVRTTAYADRMLWPRAAIIAELGWSNPRKDWPAFSERLVGAMQRWRAMGEPFDLTPLEPQASFGGSDQAMTGDTPPAGRNWRTAIHDRRHAAVVPIAGL